MQQLDERTRTVIQKRWLDENKNTLQELAAQLHISVERVRQIELAGMKKLKSFLVSQGINDNTPSLENKPISKE